MSTIQGISGLGSFQGVSKPGAAGGMKFSEVLKSKLAGLKWSAHAEERMRSRGISLSDRDRASLDGALRKAAEKGSRNSLFLLRETGFVVSVENKTVVTAIDKADLKERVFTDIDSTVIVE